MSLTRVTRDAFTTARTHLYDRQMDERPRVLLPDATDRDGAFVFLIGSILNQNISGHQAWLGAQRLVERGLSSVEAVQEGGPSAALEAIQQPPVVHPFAAAMADAIWLAASRVHTDYCGDARLIWRTATSRADLLRRLVAFRQIGAHKAEVAVYLLAEVYSVVPHEYSPKNQIKTLCPSVVDMLSSESWAIRRPEHAGTQGPDL